MHKLTFKKSPMDKKYLWLLVALLAVIVIITSTRKDSDQLPSASMTSSVSSSPTQSSKPSVTSTPQATTPAAILSYNDALKKYGDRRIQFDALCQAIPNSMSIKTGTAVMFDNRSGDGRWISLDNKGYYLNGYGFRILTLSHSTLPHTTVIDCGAAQNVGQIFIQK
jgi:hypothetical protein